MGNEEFSNTKIFVQKRIKWYEKIWYFITGKKNEWKELKGFTNISIKEKNND